MGGHLAVAEYLVLKMGGQVFDTSDGGYTALHWAAEHGQLLMIDFLIRSCGFDVQAKDKVAMNYTHSFLLVVVFSNLSCD